MRTAWLLFLLAVTACGSSPAASAPATDAGGDATIPADAGPLLCSFECGAVDASVDGSITLLCKVGQICGLVGTIPGFQCCTPSDPPGDNCYPGPASDAAACAAP